MNDSERETPEVDKLEENERHDTFAETMYWCNQYKLKARSLERQLKIATLKNQNSLANNLCPDHRDKQAFKPCLACEIERLERQRNWFRSELDAARKLANLYRGAITSSFQCEKDNDVIAEHCPVCLLEERNELRERLRWISIKDRWPPPIDRNEDEGTDYLTIMVNKVGGKHFAVLQWRPDTGYERWWSPDPRPDYTVTHYMPLPNPPKDNGDG